MPSILFFLYVRYFLFENQSFVWAKIKRMTGKPFEIYNAAFYFNFDTPNLKGVVEHEAIHILALEKLIPFDLPFASLLSYAEGIESRDLQSRMFRTVLKELNDHDGIRWEDVLFKVFIDIADKREK